MVRQVRAGLGVTLVGGGQLVGLHTGDAFDDPVIDQRLMLPPKQGGLTNLSFGCDRSDRLSRAQPGNDLPAHNCRVHTGQCQDEVAAVAVVGS